MVWVHCDKHNDRSAVCYCPVEKTMICHKCALDLHSDHKGAIVEIGSKEVTTYCLEVVDKLNNFKARITNVTDSILKLQHKHKSYSSTQFMRIVSDSNDILGDPSNRVHLFGMQEDFAKCPDLSIKMASTPFTQSSTSSLTKKASNSSTSLKFQE